MSQGLNLQLSSVIPIFQNIKFMLGYTTRSNGCRSGKIINNQGKTIMVIKKQHKKIDPINPVLKRKKVKLTKKIVDRIIDIFIDRFMTAKKRNKKSR